MPQTAMTTNASEDQQRGNQAQFLANDGEYEVALDFRNETQFLQSVAEAEAGHAARAKRDHALLRLKRCAVQMFLRVQPGGDAVHAHRVVQNGNRQSRRAAQRGNEQMFPANARNQQHHAADGSEQNGCAAVGFDKNQTQRRRNDNSRGK